MSYPKVLLSCCLMALSSQLTAAEFQHCELPTDSSSFEFVSDSSKLVALSLKNAPTDGLEEVFYDVHATEPDHIYLVNIDRHAREIAKHVYQDYTHFYYNEDQGGTLIISKYPVNPKQILPNRALAQPLEIETSGGLLLAHVMCLRPEIILAKSYLEVSAGGKKEKDKDKEDGIEVSISYRQENDDHSEVEVKNSTSVHSDGSTETASEIKYKDEDSNLQISGSINTATDEKKDESSVSGKVTVRWEF